MTPGTLAARERLTLTRLIEEGLALRLRRATGVAAGVNVLVAASRSDHPHHPVALRWLEESLAECSLGQRLAAGRGRRATGGPSGEWPLLEPLCREHQLVGNAIATVW